MDLTPCPTAIDAPHLDGRAVPIITAYLFHAGGHDDPERLRANKGKCFQGCTVLGGSSGDKCECRGKRPSPSKKAHKSRDARTKKRKSLLGRGFTFDDNEVERGANPVELMNELITNDPLNAERIFPYIGGAELNESPTHSHHRYVISFGEMTEKEARMWPDLMKILEEKVRPERLKDNRESYRTYWWQFAERRVDLANAIRGMDRLLVTGRTSEYGGFAFLPRELVYSGQLVVFPVQDHGSFCLFQSRCFELWGRFFSSTQEDRYRFTPSDALQSFPCPTSPERPRDLEDAGKNYYEFRADLMVRNNEGLTKTYNRFHDPDERSPDIFKLRELHAAMDHAVLDAYGWTDLKPTCEFLLDYEEDEDEDETGGTRRRKKPWRYRWPDDFRDEVLARLLELNRQRAEEERRSGAAESVRGKSTKKSTKGRKADTKKPDQPEFFES